MAANKLNDKLTPGTIWRPPRAVTWNNMVDCAREFAERTGTGDAGTRERNRFDPSVVWVKNSTGADRRAGEVVELDTALVTDTAGQPFEWWFDGVSPDASALRAPVILRNAVKSTEFTQAQYVGIVRALVNIVTAGDAYAHVADGNHVLQSVGYGPIRILHGTGSTGEKTCLVELSMRESGVVLKTTSTITAATDSGGTRTPGSGTALVYRRDGSGDLVDAGLNEVTLYNMTTQTTTSGKYIQAKFDLAGDLWWDTADC